MGGLKKAAPRAAAKSGGGALSMMEEIALKGKSGLKKGSTRSPSAKAGAGAGGKPKPMSMLEEMAAKQKGGLRKRAGSFRKKKAAPAAQSSMADLMAMKAKQRNRRSSALAKLLEKG